MHVLFLLYSYRSHCDLHSFPTRRSSDLGLARHAGAARRNEKGIGIFCFQQSATSFLQVLLQPVHRLLAKRDQALLRTDRKSTRLNSSHTVISYAVFCLKKKKNKI